MKALIIGYGYVGSALAKTLEHQKIAVSATTRDLSKYKLIEEEGFEAILLEDNKLPPLEGFDIICITVAPDQTKNYELTYKQVAIQIQSKNPSCKHLIYTSSTSVYLENAGGVVHEDSPLDTSVFTKKILIETEEILSSLQTATRNVCIFRLGEIYGPGREISEKMKKMHFISSSDGLRFSNMIHLDDICKAFLFAIKENLSGIYNLVDDDHFLKRDLYDLVSKKYEIDFVQFTGAASEQHGGNKRVSNKKLKEQGFRWKHPLRVLC